MVRGHRPGNQSDQNLTPKALAAVAEAARRSREVGIGLKPRRSQAEAPRAYRDADEPVTAPPPPQAAQVAQTSSHAGYVPTVPVAAPERLAARERRAGTQRFGDPAIQNPPRRLRGSQPAWTVRDSDVPARATD